MAGDSLGMCRLSWWGWGETTQTALIYNSISRVCFPHFLNTKTADKLQSHLITIPFLETLMQQINFPASASFVPD
jgi:hypothetical protein